MPGVRTAFCLDASSLEWGPTLELLSEIARPAGDADDVSTRAVEPRNDAAGDG
jgi:hypothetical protein